MRYDKDKARDANYAPSLLVNEDKGQNIVSVLALVRYMETTIHALSLLYGNNRLKAWPLLITRVMRKSRNSIPSSNWR